MLLGVDEAAGEVEIPSMRPRGQTPRMPGQDGIGWDELQALLQ